MSKAPPEPDLSGRFTAALLDFDRFLADNPPMSTETRNTSNKTYPAGNCVYMLLCADGSYYTGWTTDFSKRMKIHMSGKGAKYTRSRLPVMPVYLEYVEDRSHGLIREASIKKLTHQGKRQLINSSLNQL